MEHERTSLKPDHEDLASVEQLQDRSDLSSIYPNPTALNDGELVSKEEREHRKEAAVIAISSDAPRSTLKLVSFFLSPLIIAASIVYGFSLFLTLVEVGLYLPGIVISIGIVLLISWFFYRQFADILYNHTIQVGPFVGILIGYLAPTAFLSVHLGIGLVQPFGQHVQFAAVIGLIALITTVSTWALLTVWVKIGIPSAVRTILIILIFAVLSAAAAVTPLLLAS